MPRSLPRQPSLEHLRNEAKALLKSHQQRDVQCCETLRQLVRFARSGDDEILDAHLTLQEIQHALAREYGFANWKQLRDHVSQKAAFARLVNEALDVLTTKGPARDSTRSEWEQQRASLINKLLAAGDEGFGVMVELSQAANGRARNAATIFFGRSDDDTANEHLQRLLKDEATSVRSRAVRFYASRIHPSRRRGNVWDIREPADAVPEGVSALLPLVSDASVKVRMDVLAALSAYAALGDDRIQKALRHALADPHHKICHAAAGILRVACPGCGNEPPTGEAPG